AVPLMAVIIVLATRRSVMGEYKASPMLQVLGWIGTGVMGIAALGMLIPG
ncbi:MAG: divalent metal cation transporter, partial [Caulobacteraceae bacterium]|nr:divalent metal cation transporter [Caulobacteraceae bacterium]